MVQGSETGKRSQGIRGQAPKGQSEEFSETDRPSLIDWKRSPLYAAENSPRYERQSIIKAYKEHTDANLVAVIDQIYPTNMTILQELLGDCDASENLHVILSSPGGDGETALRMVRLMHSRAREVTIVVPDMAKSAATILCLGADHILMGPSGDLGPIDPQMILDRNSMVSAKEIVAAVDEAEKRVNDNEASFPLFSSLLSDVNMLMVEQARSALSRSESLMRESLASLPSRTSDEVTQLAERLKRPLIDTPSSHSAVFSSEDAAHNGLPVEVADTNSKQWKLIWMLWTRYFSLGCFPAGDKAIYEGLKVSHLG